MRRSILIFTLVLLLICICACPVAARVVTVLPWKLFLRVIITLLPSFLY